MTLAHAEVAVGRAGVLVARERVNPTLSLAPERLLSAVAAGSPWVAVVSLVWPVQTAGKRALAIEQALASQDASLLSSANNVWQLRAAVRAAVCTAEHVSGLVRLAQEEFALREELVKRLEAQAAAGLITRYEAARARLERDGAAVTLHQAAAQLQAALQDMAAITGLPLPEISIYAPGDTCLGSRLVASSAEAATIATAAVATRLDLRARFAEVRAADAAWRTEVAKRIPDLNLGPGYTYDQGVNKINFSISGELPIFAHNDAGITRASAERQRLMAETDVLQDAVLTSVARAMDQMRAAELQYSAAGDLANQAQQLLNRDMARQVHGELDQAAVVVSRIAVVSANAAVLVAQRGLVDAVAAFEAAAQAPLAPPFFDGRAAQGLFVAEAP
jgi:outer membrane protein, heavy metal efflux system